MLTRDTESQCNFNKDEHGCMDMAVPKSNKTRCIYGIPVLT